MARADGFAPEELIAFVAGDEPSGEPGRHFAYSDTHYILLGLIIEKATGRRYYDLAREMLIVPMALTSTTPLTGRDHPGLATGYQRSGVARMIAGVSGPSVSRGRLVAVPDFEWTGGGFVTTPADLAKFYHMLFADPRFSEIASMMLADVNVNPISEGREYGLGVFVRERLEGDRLSHGGDFMGYGSFVMFDRETGLTVAVMTNDGDFEASELAIQILSGLTQR
ncbi:MAG: beta-lactamase family protein [Rhodomicrobium sp.]|nr:beta-lactamase family protein [Rhodomicrobium sp.]